LIIRFRHLVFETLLQPGDVAAIDKKFTKSMRTAVINPKQLEQHESQPSSMIQSQYDDSNRRPKF
jgi:hypothetical protein